MALGKRSKSRSPNSGRGDAAQVNCVQTVRTEPQRKWRRATGVKKGKGGHEIRSDVSGETDVRNAEKSYCGALGGHPCKMNTYNGSEGVESMKLRVGEVKLIIGRVTQTTACLERELERMGEKVRHIEQSMSEIVNDAAIEDIVNEVVEAVSARERGKKIYMQKGMGIPRTTGVTRFRKGNIEAHKVKEHVKRVVDDMEVKRLKSKGRKQMHRSTKRNFCAFANEGVMSGKNADLLRFLFRKNFVGEEKWSTEVARYGEFAVTRMEFQCLSPATSLSCKVINICAAYLDEADGDCWFLPTYFGERARCNEEQSCFANWVASTVDMCGLWRFHRRLRFCSKIFIPLHDRVDDHWFLLVMHLHEKKALLWDSYPDPNSVARRMCHAREVMTLMQKVFSCQMTMFGDVYYHFPSFSVNLAEGQPTNPQTFDSGIFVIRHMQHYVDPWSIGFISEEHRNRVALEIVQSPRNEHRRVVMVAAVGTLVRSTTVGGENAFCPPKGSKCRSHRKRRDRAIRHPN